MQNPLRFSILSWSFHPGDLLAASGEAPALARPPQSKLSVERLALDFVPASLRRRCSPFARASLAVAHAAGTGDGTGAIDMPTIFASAHGESEITEQLLRQIAEETPLSPMGFSLSVHNASSGVFSIATGNKAPASAIAANEDTFIMGLCEAALQLSQQNHDRVLYVCSDDRVPEVFMPAADAQGMPHAIALLLARPLESRGPLVTAEIYRDCEAAAQDQGEASVAFARWLTSGARSALRVRASHGTWSFGASAGTTSLFRPAVKEQGA